MFSHRPDPAGKELHQTLIVHVEKLVEIHPAVGVLAEGSLLLQLCGLSVTHAGYFLSGKEERDVRRAICEAAHGGDHSFVTLNMIN